MLYSRFGTPLTPISKQKDAAGRISIQATADGGSGDVHHYSIGDLKADDGMNEINDAVGKLPWRVVETRRQRRDERLR
jgi:hypothetical protein